MQSFQNALYSPYGSFALKARYQRNLIQSQFMVVACIALAIGTVKIWPSKSTVVITPVEPPVARDSVIVIIDPQPTIIKEGTRRREPLPESHHGAIPVPVTDSIEFDQTIYSRDDLARMLGPGDSLSRDNIAVIIQGTDALDDPTVFMPLEKFPEVISEIKSEYPRFAREAMIEGTVILWGKVDEEGRIIEVRVARSSGFESLDASAAAALRQFRFTPGVQNGRPVKCWIAKSFKFELE